jgi:hypothetical protein
MTPSSERRLLQAAVAIACLVPLTIGAQGVVEGPAMLKGVAGTQPADLDSHYRYLSGLLLGLGFGFASCVKCIELCGPLFRTLGLIAVLGGLARLLSLALVGTPSFGHVLGLAMELGVVPLLLVWQRRIEILFAPTS